MERSRIGIVAAMSIAVAGAIAAVSAPRAEGPRASPDRVEGIAVVRPPDPCGLDVALRELLDSPEMSAPRFAKFRDALARLIPHVPRSNRKPDRATEIARLADEQNEDDPALEIDGYDLREIKPLVKFICGDWGLLPNCLSGCAPIPTETASLLHEIYGVVGREPHGWLRMHCSSILVRRYLTWTDSTRPPAESVRDSFRSLWEFLLSPETDADETRRVLTGLQGDFDEFHSVQLYISFRAFSAPADSVPAIVKEIGAAADELRRVVTTATQKLPAEERAKCEHALEEFLAVYHPDDRAGMAEHVLRYRAWRRLAGKLVRAINANDKEAYVRLFPPGRRPKIERQLAQAPAELLNESFFGPGVESVDIHSFALDGELLWIVTAADGKRGGYDRFSPDINRHNSSNVYENADGWGFGEEPDPPSEFDPGFSNPNSPFY